MVPGVGEFLDGVNALLYLAEGDYVNAAFSAAALIPFAGAGVALGKYAVKYGDEAVSGAKTLLKSDLLQKQVKILKNKGGYVDLGVFTKGGSKFDEVFKTADNYKLSDDVFESHILDRHGPDSLFKNKSHFNSNFDIKEGIDSTLKGDNFLVKPNTNSREGYIFEQTFKNSIGADGKGKLLNTLKAVIDESGNVVTAFPKK